MRQATAFPTRLHLCPVKTQISLCICTVWSESLLCILWIIITKDSNHLQAGSQQTDQTAQMCRLIWIFTLCTSKIVGNAVPNGLPAAVFLDVHLVTIRVPITITAAADDNFWLFSFYKENKSRHFKLIVNLADNSLEMSRLVFSKK